MHLTSRSWNGGFFQGGSDIFSEPLSIVFITFFICFSSAFLCEILNQSCWNNSHRGVAAISYKNLLIICGRPKKLYIDLSLLPLPPSKLPKPPINSKKKVIFQLGAWFGARWELIPALGLKRWRRRLPIQRIRCCTCNGVTMKFKILGSQSVEESHNSIVGRNGFRMAS